MEADVAVLGSGFGGSLCALIADRIGMRPVVIDRSMHPRFAVGESSTPIADMLLRDLSERYDLPRLKPLSTWGSWQKTYPHVLGGAKRGFSYYRHDAGAAFNPDPEHHNELLVAASASDDRSDTQWYRADVDAFFAVEVRRAGIPLFEDVRVEARQEAERWHLEGCGLEVAAGFVIDATGGGGALLEALKIPSSPSRTCSRALFSHFTGVPRWQDAVASRGARVDDYPFSPDWAALHHVLDGAWMWMLRFKNDLLSAGLVLDDERHPPDPSRSPESEWQMWLARYPSLRDLFAEARLASSPGRLIRTGRLQRRASQAAGPNWALLPHTAGFIDPLHSTGIAHTLCGIERLMEALETCRSRAELLEALGAYEQDVLRELALVDRLVAACYRATGCFELWTATTMIYFAAATSYEHLRANDSNGQRLFLLADDPVLSEIADEAIRRLERMRRPGKRDVSAFQRWLERSLQPYNRVGLFRPRIPNMYEYTATTK